MSHSDATTNDATQPVLTSYPDVLDGTPVFTGTQVPAKTFVEYLISGKNVAAFLEDFPTVTREVALRFLQEGHDHMVANATELFD